MSSRLTQLFAFLEEAPSDPFLLFAVAKEYEKMEQEEEALAYYLKLTAEQPDYVGTYYHLGKLYERQGKVEAALSIYQKGVEMAKAASDQHALSELMGAKWELED
ncbi:MAG: tetratricopeptide repeat protein [Bacteroidota bacterium]